MYLCLEDVSAGEQFIRNKLSRLSETDQRQAEIKIENYLSHKQKI